MQCFLSINIFMLHHKVCDVSIALPRELYECNSLAVGHTGIHFIVKSSNGNFLLHVIFDMILLYNNKNVKWF